MKKYRIYIDEVGNPDLKNSDDLNHRFLCLSGVIFDLDYTLQTFHPELENLKTKYFEHHPDEPLIFHRKELVCKEGKFRILKNPDLEKSFNKDLLSLLEKWDFKIISSIIDKKEFCDLYPTWNKDPYHLCLDAILERYRGFLKMNQTVGDVMIESRGGKEDLRLKESFRDLMDNGSAFLKPSDFSEFLTSKELKIRNKAANIAGLQLADLLAHSVRRFAFDKIWEIRENKKTFSDEILDILINQKKFFSYKDRVNGWGIKKLP
ncbi:MAG: DUF3800 domain-containing protein [Rickettsiales bacterium]|nr:DUF3800 domain-containing protein [Rickettsiales bacterium]